MISTLEIKQAQLRNGFFTVGSGKEVMLIMGSCRVAPYVSYFKQWNEQNENRFTIHTLDPFNFHWNIEDERVDYELTLLVWQTDQRMLNMLKSVDIFVHEFYKNAGMFNCDKESDTGIYSFGMKAKIDICIPSFNDCFILAKDILKFDYEIAKKAQQDLNVLGRLSKQTEWDIYIEGQKGLDKFHKACMLSDLPEMSACFSRQWATKRFFHSYNHITKWFTLAVYELLLDKYLNDMVFTNEYWDEISKEDMFGNSFTPLTNLDVKHYGLEWGEEVVPLAL